MMFQEEVIGYARCHRVLDTRLVTFAQQTAMQLNDPTLRRYPTFRFPGGLPVTVEKRHVPKIQTGQYMFTAKADGLRVALVFFVYYIDGDWQKLCTTLMRDGSCHLLSLDVPTELFENGGSLFDGELVSTRSGWSDVLLFDCYSYAGCNMRALPLTRRFARCKGLCAQSHHRAEDSVRLAAKPFYRLNAEHLPDARAFTRNANHFL